MSGEDLIAVRKDERLDEAAVAAWLRGQGLLAAGETLTVRQFAGGKANLTYLLELAGRPLVLRRPPLGPVAPGAHDMVREYQVLSRLHTGFDKAPRALALCTDLDALGAPFFVMTHRPGIVVRERMPAAFADDPRSPTAMADALVDTLAELHAVDPSAVGLADLGQPEGFMARQVAGWYRRWQAATDSPLPAMDSLHDWLAARVPAPQRVALVHNDYKLDNVVLAADDPGRVVAVLDWDMCTLGDPLSDLGALLTYWIGPDDPAPFRAMATMPVDPRFPDRAALVARYAQRTGLDLSGIAWYHVLGLFRLAVILAQIHVRWRRGQTADPRFARFGEFAALAADWALRVAGAQRRA
ncbi:MAG: phosphotransferase family protein [Xanthomonadales bacterium]|nr:phosphotransferase family protein [Xanthomonadales bacterium]